jgi:hypothetical protein
MTWTREDKLARLAELQAADPPRAAIENLPERARRLIPDDRLDEVADHLRHFGATADCPSCGSGSWGFAWGFQHGCGRCSNCGWPATAYHFIGNEGEERFRFEAILWAHPSEVGPRPEIANVEASS